MQFSKEQVDTVARDLGLPPSLGSHCKHVCLFWLIDSQFGVVPVGEVLPMEDEGSMSMAFGGKFRAFFTASEIYHASFGHGGKFSKLKDINLL